MTCNRKPQTGVRITPVLGSPITILCVESGAAQALQRAIDDNTDARAQVVGLVHELPVISAVPPAPSVSGAAHNSAQVLEQLTISFDRSAPASACLVELRDVAWAEDDHGGFWKAQALWAHNSAAVADPAPAPAPAAPIHQDA